MSHYIQKKNPISYYIFFFQFNHLYQEKKNIIKKEKKSCKAFH